MDYLPYQQLLEHNDTAFIENPVRRIPEDDLTAYIESFSKEYELERVVDVTTLVRGARLERDEEAFKAESKREGSLTLVEEAALDKEKHMTIWKETRELKIILLTCCVGSVVHGWVSGILPSQECATSHTFTLKTHQEQNRLS